MILTYKYRIKDRIANKQLAAHAIAVNQVWNWCVAQHRDAFNRYRSGAPSRKWLSAFDLCATMRGVGKDLGLHQQTVQSVCDQWVRGRSIRFRSSFGAKRATGWVPFQRQSRRVDGNSIIYRGKRYRFFGEKRRPLPEVTKGGAFVEDSQGRWWVTFQVEIADRAAPTNGEIGIDLGLKTFATLSNGRKIEAPRIYRSMEVKLAVAQRAGNRHRAKAIHTKIKNCRADFLHKISTDLAGQNALIAVGDVNSKRLARTRMAKSVTDAGWSTFRAMLHYKSPGYVEVDEKFTTQICSSCGSLPPERPKGIAGLGIRAWSCSDCGVHHDRDVNAARNILMLARSVPRRGDESRGAVQ